MLETEPSHPGRPALCVRADPFGSDSFRRNGFVLLAQHVDEFVVGVPGVVIDRANCTDTDRGVRRDDRLELVEVGQGDLFDEDVLVTGLAQQPHRDARQDVRVRPDQVTVADESDIAGGDFADRAVGAGEDDVVESGALCAGALM